MTEFMDKNSYTLNDNEPHLMILEYDINDIKLSIQETIGAIEKFAFDREITKRHLNKKQNRI
jgi:hypothetical protein